MDAEATTGRHAATPGGPADGSDLAPVPADSLTFDEALAELGRTVARLEAGGASLEESIVLYERGVALHERCARLLADAELRVQRLVERAGGALQAIDMPAGEPGPGPG